MRDSRTQQKKPPITSLASLAALAAQSSPLESVPAVGLVQTPGQLAAFNSAADAATAAAAPSGWSLSGIGSAGNYLLPAVGALGALDLFQNKKHGAKGAAQGALSGAAIGSGFGGPVGAGIGALVGGGVGYFGNLGDKDRFKDEWNRKKKLVEQGVISESELGPEPLRGRSDAELLAEAKASGGPTKFAETRDERYLTPDEVANFAFLPEKFGKDYAGASLAQKKAVSQMLIDAGAIKEHHGQLDFNDKLTSDLEGKIKEQLKIPLSEVAPMASPPQSGQLDVTGQPEGDAMKLYAEAMKSASKKEKATKILGLNSIRPLVAGANLNLRNEYL